MEQNNPTNPENNQENEPKKQEKLLRPLPFNISQPTRERFLKHFEKSSDQALNALIDAYENRSQNSENTTDPKLKSENEKLANDLNQALSSIADKDRQIADLQSQVESAKATAKSAEKPEDKEKIKSLNTEIAQLKADIDRLTSENKEQKKLLEGRSDQKKAYEDIIANLEKTIGLKDKKLQEDEELLKTANAGQYNHSENFLTHFEPIVSALLVRTAEKLTEARRDEIEVTPAMILGDMFLKYTLQKRTMWFYRWVLSDAEILDIAKMANPNIQSIRMLRKVLMVDQELN